ncbi:MAG: hypothetical protein IID41_13860, partial [Planctomycetes bacterium]|nr:hypothetical protein [Planctomycetota bacterium]
ALYVYYQFERIYRMIYGTQLLFLEALLVASERKASEEQFNPFFDEHVKRTADEPNYTADKGEYLAFLTNSDMMEVDIEAQSYRLSKWGAVFLDYIHREGLPRLKRY